MRGTGVVVVTGASAGVGRAVAEEFGRRGWAVALLARGSAGLAAAVRDVEAAGGTALALPTDVADPDAVEAAARRTEKELGPLDVWVNNAMATVFAPSWEVAPEEFRRATEVTYLGQVYGTLAALRRMRPRDRGMVLNVGSALAHRAIALQAPYCAAKFATRGFSEAVRVELLQEHSRVRISTVDLPAVNTPQFSWCRNLLPKHPRPVPPVYAPEVAARHIVAVALRPRRQKVVGSFNQLVVWASKLAPGIMDHYIARTTVASQQADFDADPDRPHNLWDPVDGKDGSDHGAEGVFDTLEGGMLHREALTGLPQQALAVLRSTGDRLAEVVRDRTGSTHGGFLRVGAGKDTRHGCRTA
jgi:NAD(P)-dependent dehydrogenase (short-subunit alcohol dehydrogenase family)